MTKPRLLRSSSATVLHRLLKSKRPPCPPNTEPNAAIHYQSHRNEIATPTALPLDLTEPTYWAVA